MFVLLVIHLLLLIKLWVKIELRSNRNQCWGELRYSVLLIQKPRWTYAQIEQIGFNVSCFCTDYTSKILLSSNWYQTIQYSSSYNPNDFNAKHFIQIKADLCYNYALIPKYKSCTKNNVSIINEHIIHRESDSDWKIFTVSIYATSFLDNLLNFVRKCIQHLIFLMLLWP